MRSKIRHAFSGLFFPPDAWLYRLLIPSCQIPSDQKWRVWNVAMWTQRTPHKNPFNSICRRTNVLHREHLPRIRRWRIRENTTAREFTPSETQVCVWLLFCLTGKKKNQCDRKISEKKQTKQKNRKCMIVNTPELDSKCNFRSLE